LDEIYLYLIKLLQESIVLQCSITHSVTNDNTYISYKSRWNKIFST